ncbi:hypothetical protein BJF83_19950 [Nocardiopsis sp. CNR-923]|uniref:ATP-binding protein n=1 Tax=Nocardiopsis sp. CNR-923 TaxID=1904965 RepID=UPI00096659AE|nr:ATP-binding protein [Nocardiopsis sp. CNR-923]OLT26883.1 hypothetical protein BJF83_19950 [Nocardiopsis sp. CNR-923]
MITAPEKPAVARRTFDGVPDSIPTTRQWGSDRLHELGVTPTEDFRYDFQLVLSELVTNAMVHTHSGDPNGTFAVRLKVYPDRVRVEVRDAGPLAGRTPTRRTPKLAAEHGRGLRLVDALTERWGRLPVGTGMWAEVTR